MWIVEWTKFPINMQYYHLIQMKTHIYWFINSIGFVESYIIRADVSFVIHCTTKLTMINSKLAICFEKISFSFFVFTFHGHWLKKLVEFAKFIKFIAPCKFFHILHAGNCTYLFISYASVHIQKRSLCATTP